MEIQLLGATLGSPCEFTVGTSTMGPAGVPA